MYTKGPQPHWAIADISSAFVPEPKPAATRDRFGAFSFELMLRRISPSCSLGMPSEMNRIVLARPGASSCSSSSKILSNTGRNCVPPRDTNSCCFCVNSCRPSASIGVHGITRSASWSNLTSAKRSCGATSVLRLARHLRTLGSAAPIDPDTSTMTSRSADTRDAACASAGAPSRDPSAQAPCPLATASSTDTHALSPPACSASTEKLTPSSGGGGGSSPPVTTLRATRFARMARGSSSLSSACVADSGSNMQRKRRRT
mmetsp:Transcript_89096/g.275840  ORF Transcript_89096/g.275840 Transcript_89096/m.275840 type:complete len:259 (+) Transcript_89096:100-876(+)